MDKPGSREQMDLMTEKRRRFKVEVCRRQCQFCGKIVQPDFCEFLFESDPEAFLNEILAVMITIRERLPRFAKELKEPEGFKALFCGTKEICKQFRSPHCMNKVDCYQVFMLQSGVPINKGDEFAVLTNWDKNKYRECQDQISKVRQIIDTGLKPKRRKKLLKILRKLGNLYRGIGNPSVKTKKKGAHKPVNTQPKKEVTTRFFCRWPEKFAAIFNEGESAACASKSETE